MAAADASARLSASSLDAVVAGIAARTPVPGGGAAAALSAALGCAAGAMAARYTTGERWQDRAAVSSMLASQLDQAGRECSDLADADARAYAAVGQARKANDEAALAVAERHSAAVPARVLEVCAQQVARLLEFRPLCNPQLVSDVEVAIAILVGAGRAAACTLWANRSSAAVRLLARTHLEALSAASASAPLDQGMP